MIALGRLNSCSPNVSYKDLEVVGMKKISRYTRPILHGHKTLYKGRRYWVFEVSSEFPYKGYEEDFSMVLYDCLYDGVITGGKIEAGHIKGYVQFGMGNIDVSGATLTEFIEDATSSSDWVHREYGG